MQRQADAMIIDGYVPAQVNLQTDLTTVYTGACKVKGIFVSAVPNTGVCLIKDGSTTVFTIPTTIPLGWHDLGDAEFSTSLVVDPDNADASGLITICYNPLRPAILP